MQSSWSLALPLAVACAACATTAARRGPLPVRNQHPAQLTVLHLDPAAAATLPPGEVAVRASAAYSSLFLAGSGGGNTFQMDGELLRVGLLARAGLLRGLEAGVELPLLYTTGGFLDSFLIRYHDLFGFPNQGRDDVPDNQFHVAATYQGQTVFAMDEYEFGLGDVPVSLTWSVLPPARGRLGLAVRAGLELPVGDPGRGFGNDQLDYGGGILLELPLGFGSLYGHAQHTFAGTPPAARAAGFSFADVTSAGLGAELPLLDDLAALVQVEWETSTLRNLDFGRAARDQVLLWAGARMHLDSDWCLEFALSEDLQAFVSPDVTFWLGMARLPAVP